jgi:Lipocalin-like domain
MLICAVAPSISIADQCQGPQIGTWTLLSYTEKDPMTREITSPYGLYPTGVLSYTPDCHMYEMIVREHRAAPESGVPTDAEKINLFDGLIAFSGRYTIDGSRFKYQVDASWNQSWTGGIQTRQFRIEENNLYVELPPTRNRDGKLTTPTLIWTRVLSPGAS